MTAWRFCGGISTLSKLSSPVTCGEFALEVISEPRTWTLRKCSCFIDFIDSMAGFSKQPIYVFDDFGSLIFYLLHLYMRKTCFQFVVRRLHGTSSNSCR